MNNLKEQHWINLFGKYDSESLGWFGTWTTYSPEKEVLKTFQGVRCFRANEDKTVITHTNDYTFSDGSTSSKSWTLEKQSCNQSDGVVHPAISGMRTIYLNQNATAWVTQKRQIDQSFGAELFFYHENKRTSVAHIYNAQGELEKITQIREQWGNFPEYSPRETLTQLSGSWIGEKQSITPDLKLSEPEKVDEFVFDPTPGKNKCIFLPDGVVCYLQKSVKFGESFEITAGQFVSDKEYKRITAEYDESGVFIRLTCEIFHRIN
ncbi:MAG: DUF3598 family protein [Limnoraphis sp. WC205]|jgi:hypothetical protein|nr:DUF3598 family protein [Limnoraphis sp. WC205]